MLWIHSINETAAPEFNEGIMNPMSPEKIRMLGQRLRLKQDQEVLDIGAGRCGPALVLAREFGCRVTVVEPFIDFLSDGRRRVSEAGLSDKFRFIEARGAEFDIEPGRYDACMCLGATWAWDDLNGTLDALARGTRVAGHVVAGEPYARHPDQKPDLGVHGLELGEIIESFESRALHVVTMIRSTTEDWDTYNSIQTISLLDWLEANHEHPELETVRGWRAEAARRLAEPHIGWAMVAGRKGANSR
jgi:SAM-dependent methyltransferase